MADWPYGNMPDGLDMDALLAPVSDEAPAGPDLREDYSPRSIYLRLRDARMAVREAEKQEDQGSRDPSAEPTAILWRQVRTLAVEALGQSKDLEAAAWLLESLLRSDGPRGLAAGAFLIGGLVDAYWERDLHPPEDEDGVESRVQPITGLNGQGGDGTLAQPLRKMVLFNRADGSPLAFWQYKQSEELRTLDGARAAQRVQAGAVPLDTVEAEARAAGRGHFAALRRDLRAARDAWVAMGEVLDARVGADAPSVRAVRELLEEILAIAERYAPAEEAAAPDEEAQADAVGEGPADASGGGSGLGRGRLVGAVSREDMFKELSRIAEYFRTTEPQSPLGYTLEEAIRRGRMTWPELLAEIVSDTAVRDNILMQLGIRPPSEAAGEGEGGEGSGSSW
jgi:type VI secretion system protein ImpA